MIKLVGLILLVIGGFGLIGGVAPNQFSTALMNLSTMFLSETASMIFWASVLLLGLVMLEPREGVLNSLSAKIRK